jgi:hypothetical protein
MPNALVALLRKRHLDMLQVRRRRLLSGIVRMGEPRIG